jgi:arsenate reductase-like glutaredoxin family protein
VDELYVSKRKQVTHLNLKKDKPNEETLHELLLGPTGNLRAPTFRIGRTLVVGFDEATYRKLFK